MNKNTHPKPDWTQRGNVTLPIEMVDYIKGVAHEQKMPVYQLVYDAVKLYALYRSPLSGSEAHQ